MVVELLFFVETFFPLEAKGKLNKFLENVCVFGGSMCLLRRLVNFIIHGSKLQKATRFYVPALNAVELHYKQCKKWLIS
jgi:hypothetical protein